MNSKKFIKALNTLKPALSVFLITVLAACGAQAGRTVTVSGTVNVPSALETQARGPLFIGVSRTDDVELMKNDAKNQIVALTPVEQGAFEIDLTGRADTGDRAFIFTFFDNDYSGGIPNPTEGDIIGFYINSETLATKVELGTGSTDLTLDAERMTYDISPEVIGIIDGTESGDVIMIAYAGDFNSLDFRAIEKSAIIGYEKFYKESGPCPYSMKILPYITPEKYSLPIMRVYIIALLDVNANGMPDEGDIIGYAGDSGYPESINVQDGRNSTSPINFKRTIAGTTNPGNPMKLTGTFDAPDGYTEGSPMFLIIAKSSDPNEVFADLGGTVKSLNNVTGSWNAGDRTFSYDMDLSSTGLLPGDTVMIIALWDRDYTGGFPAATAGDMVGYIQNKNNFAFTVQLAAGNNLITKVSGGAYSYNGNSGYDFSLKRKIYDHGASIRFRLEKGVLSAAGFANGKRVQVIALYDSGGYSLINKNIDMDNIIATDVVLLQLDAADSTVTVRYTMPVMSAVPVSISGIDPSDFSIPDVYIAAFIDSNGNGRPDSGELVAYLYRTIIIDIPDKMTVYDGVNVTDKNIKFETSF